VCYRERFKNTRVRCRLARPRDRAHHTYLLVNHVAQEQVFVIRVLVLLGEHGFRVHEVLARAAVRALSVRWASALAGPFAHDSKNKRSELVPSEDRLTRNPRADRRLDPSLRRDAIDASA